MRSGWIFVCILIGWTTGSAWGQTLAVLCKKDHKLRFFDGKTGKVLAEEPVATTASAIALPAGGLRVFVAEEGKPEEPDAVLRTVSIITGKTEATLLLPNCKGRVGLAPGPEGRMLVSCSESESLLEVSAVDGGLQQRHRVGSGAIAMAFHAETETYVIASRAKGEVLLFDLQDHKISWRQEAGQDLLGLAQGFGNTMIALLDGEKGTLRIFDPEGHSLGSPISVMPPIENLTPTPPASSVLPEVLRPHNLLFLGESAGVLLTIEGPQGLVLVDVEEEAVQRSLELGPGTAGLAANSGGTTAWVSLESSNLVAAVDVETWAVQATLPIPGGPTDLVYLKD